MARNTDKPPTPESNTPMACSKGLAGLSLFMLPMLQARAHVNADTHAGFIKLEG